MNERHEQLLAQAHIEFAPDAKVEDPNKVWCEVTDMDLENFEETK